MKATITEPRFYPGGHNSATVLSWPARLGIKERKDELLRCIPANGHEFPSGRTKDNKLCATRLESIAVIVGCRQKIIRQSLLHRDRDIGRHNQRK